MSHESVRDVLQDTSRHEIVRRMIVRHADVLFTTDPDSGVDSICREVLDACAEDILFELDKHRDAIGAFLLEQEAPEDSAASEGVEECPICRHLLNGPFRDANYPDTPCIVCSDRRLVRTWNPGEAKAKSAGQVRAIARGLRWRSTPQAANGMRVKIDQRGNWAQIGSTPGKRSLWPWLGTVLQISDTHIFVHLDPA